MKILRNMRVARRDVRIVIANENALRREVDFQNRVSVNANNKLLRPVIGSAHYQTPAQFIIFCFWSRIEGG